MTHVSGNATWQDYPSTATLITATSLESIETVVDTLAANRPVCEVRLTTAFSPVAVTDTFAQNGWTVQTDPFSMVHLAPGAGTFTYVQIPTGWAGRYLLRYHATSSIGSGGTHAVKIALNSAATTSSVATGLAVRGAAGGDGAVVDAITEVVLAAGDKLYWCNFTSVSAPVQTSASGINVPTAFSARYIGSI